MPSLPRGHASFSGTYDVLTVRAANLAVFAGIPANKGLIVRVPDGVPAGLYWITEAGTAVSLASVAGGGNDSTVRFNFTFPPPATTDSTTPIPAGAIVKNATVSIVDAFSPGTTVSVGDPGLPNRLLDVTDDDPQTPGLYNRLQDTVWPAATPVRVTVAGGPIVGSGICIVTFTVPDP